MKGTTWCIHVAEEAKLGQNSHFLSVYFFSISALPCRNKADSNINRPESAIHGRIIRPHQFLNHFNYPSVNWGFIYLVIPVITFIVGYTVFLELHQSNFVGDFCGRQLNNCQPTSSNIYIMDFLFGSKANPITVPNNSTAWTTNLGLQQPTPSKLATLVAAADEKEVKNDYVYYEMNDQKKKTFSRKKNEPSVNRKTRTIQIGSMECGP